MHDPTLSDRPLPPQETKKFTCTEQAGSVHLHPEGKLNSQKPKLCGVWEKNKYVKIIQKRGKNPTRLYRCITLRKHEPSCPQAPCPPTHCSWMDRQPGGQQKGHQESCRNSLSWEGSRSSLCLPLHPLCPEFGGLACLHPLHPKVPG